MASSVSFGFNGLNTGDLVAESHPTYDDLTTNYNTNDNIITHIGIIMAFVLVPLVIIWFNIWDFYRRKFNKLCKLRISRNLTRVFSDDKLEENCSICLEKIFDQKSDVVALKLCNHIFHLPCIEDWTDRNKSCPICRQSVDEVHTLSIPCVELKTFSHNNFETSEVDIV